MRRKEVRRAPAVIAVTLCIHVWVGRDICVRGDVCVQTHVRHVCVSRHWEFFDTNVQLKQNGRQGETDAMLVDTYARPQRGGEGEGESPRLFFVVTLCTRVCVWGEIYVVLERCMCVGTHR